MDRKQFEEWFKTTLSYAIFEDSNVWKVDLYAFNEPTNSYLHSGVQAAFESYQHQQAKVEELEKHIVDLEQQMLRDSALATKAQIERNELQTIYTQQGINMLKMQKRVDALSKRLSEATGLVVEDLEQALKGVHSD
ncbi:hypothetical protein OW684_01745 [Acinetobacter baumannii]|uniref:hypothetical protein n=1 Tax=Acinetobacter baumannii TaxID=470 RepID=UPI0024DE968A|nr:hypothetical protein [Acinetobacter baumannii]MDK2105136.1 hypothetical protein [Acinetobacter baumannii]MDK2110472.1 hypothetical protein [Acinetobacter baumannii]MDK2139982.1 hypothetical protein [Acinetobacter baumannii]MDK2150852.1 hypothetical protein [Acinetobacter baumannii]MDK2154590.1 hypothetical protein [Acinetobacter baumannii]